MRKSWLWISAKCTQEEEKANYGEKTYFEEGCSYPDSERNNGGYRGHSRGQGFTHGGRSHLSDPRPPMRCFVCKYTNHLARDCRFKFLWSPARHQGNTYINVVEQEVEQGESAKIIVTDGAKNIEAALTKIVMNLDSCRSFNEKSHLWYFNSGSTRHVTGEIKPNDNHQTHQDRISQHHRRWSSQDKGTHKNPHKHGRTRSLQSTLCSYTTKELEFHWLPNWCWTNHCFSWLWMLDNEQLRRKEGACN